MIKNEKNERDFHKIHCGLEYLEKMSFIATSIFYVYILFKKPNKFIKNEKMKGSETLNMLKIKHVVIKYYNVKAILIPHFINQAN